MKSRSVEGDLKSFNIFDITQSLMVGRKTALVTITSEHRRGHIHFRDGQIVSASDDNLQGGVSAAMNVFSWTGGTFRIDFDVAPTDQNVEMPTDHLLLEVARSLDEVRREHGIVAELHSPEEQSLVQEAVRERRDETLRTKLNHIFRRVAERAEPTRARYTRNAFDSLLHALVDLGGTVLFLRPGQRPRVKTASGFHTIKDECVGPGEIEGFLAAVLSETEKQDLRERKEAATAFHLPELGSFRIQVVEEHGSPLLTFSPAGALSGTLEEVCGSWEVADALRAVERGLVVVAGPMGSGKAAVVSSLIEDHMEARDFFAIHFSASSAPRFTTDRGYCIRRTVPASARDLQLAVRTSIEQGPDLVAFVDTDSREAFALALSAAATSCLVVHTIESRNAADTIDRLVRLSRTSDGDSLLDLLASRLALVLDLAPTAAPAPPQTSVVVPDDEFREHLKSGHAEALKRLRLQEARAAAPASRG